MSSTFSNDIPLSAKQRKNINASWSTTQGRWHSFFEWICGLIVAYLLLVSAIPHLNNPYHFLASIYEYRLVPRLGAEALAMFLPFLHILIAFCLITRFQIRTAFTTGLILFLSYITAQILALLHGEPIACGCFESFGANAKEHLVGTRSILLAAIAGLICLAALYSSSRHSKQAMKEEI
jgi:hypothetical protein